MLRSYYLSYIYCIDCYIYTAISLRGDVGGNWGLAIHRGPLKICLEIVLRLLCPGPRNFSQQACIYNVNENDKLECFEFAVFIFITVFFNMLVDVTDWMIQLRTGCHSMTVLIPVHTPK